jgi:hypothetical protein
MRTMRTGFGLTAQVLVIITAFGLGACQPLLSPIKPLHRS